MDHHQSHVAQQSRRDRLRTHHHFQDLPNNLERFPVFPEMNTDHLRNARCSNSMYEPVVLSSGMINLAAGARPISGSAGANDLVGGGDCSVDNHQPISPAQSDPPGWRSIGACDWMVGCASGWLGGSDQANQNHPLSGGGLFSTTIMNTNTVSGSMHCNNNNNNKSNYNRYDQDMPKQCEGINFTSPLFQSSLQDVVTIASAGGSRPAGGNELALLPSYENQVFDHDSSGWSHRAVQSYSEGLSLTLSSNPPAQQPQVFHFGEGYLSGDLHSRDTQLPKDQQDFNNLDSPCSIMSTSLISRGSFGKSVKDMPGIATLTHPSTGPLGPFTGYATILKCSKFLKPAQQLLDEFCTISGSQAGKPSEDHERMSGKVSMLSDVLDVTDYQAVVRNNGCGSSAASSSTLHGSNNLSAGECTMKDRDQPHESCQPEYQQKKAKLVCMHEEVGRRYKQYHQQMQMVVSSFESVAGLGDATPYISLALKTVSRHFRCLRNAITDQLWHIRKALGEECMLPTTGASSTKGDTNTLRQKYKDHSFQKHKSAGDSVEPQQHVWRPQRGLPERSVAILRTWLFDHFLHPYPTDTDKHMLATQTGLSRNQVSNWFINARVRVWKPMVEEIHMLETNGLAQTNKKEENHVGEGTSCSNGEETASKLDTNTLARKHLEFPGIGSSSDIGSSEQWSQEKRSRVECQVPSSIDRSFMGFMPYQRGGLEMGGLGAVSLTLGLRHSAENAQHQQQQYKQQEDQLQRQFAGHMFHDFVG